MEFCFLLFQDGSAAVLTDDVSLQVFMEHLKKLAVSSSSWRSQDHMTSDIIYSDGNDDNAVITIMWQVIHLCNFKSYWTLTFLYNKKQHTLLIHVYTTKPRKTKSKPHLKHLIIHKNCTNIFLTVWMKNNCAIDMKKACIDVLHSCHLRVRKAGWIVL